MYNNPLDLHSNINDIYQFYLTLYASHTTFYFSFDKPYKNFWNLIPQIFYREPFLFIQFIQFNRTRNGFWYLKTLVEVLLNQFIIHHVCDWDHVIIELIQNNCCSSFGNTCTLSAEYVWKYVSFPNMILSYKVLDYLMF